MTDVTIVEPSLNLTTSDDGQNQTLTIETSGRGKAYSGGFLLFILILSLLGCGVMWFMSSLAQSPYAGGFSLAFFAIMAVMAVVFVLTSKPKLVKVSVDGDKLVVDDKAYLFKNITAIGYRGIDRYVVVGDAAAQGRAQVNYALSGAIVIVYGSDEISVVKGIHPTKLERYFADFVQLLAKSGRTYTV